MFMYISRQIQSACYSISLVKFLFSHCTSLLDVYVDVDIPVAGCRCCSIIVHHYSYCIRIIVAYFHFPRITAETTASQYKHIRSSHTHTHNAGPLAPHTTRHTLNRQPKYAKTNSKNDHLEKDDEYELSICSQNMCLLINTYMNCKFSI